MKYFPKVNEGRKTSKGRPNCVVLGLSMTSLGVIRSLGQKGVRVIGLDCEKSPIGSFSKYCRAQYCPSPENSESQLKTFMEHLGKQFDLPPLLIPTNDNFVLFMARNQDSLKSHYQFVLPERKVIESLNDKMKFYHLARKNKVNVPKTLFPKTIDEVIDLSKEIQYPYILKPAYGYLYNQILVKGVIVKDKTQLIKEWERLHSMNTQIILQEFIFGKDDSHYSLATYFDKDSRPLAVFTSRKLRQGPPQAGVGTLVESYVEPIIVELGITFLKKIGFKGIAEIEFKKVEGANHFIMIEVNTRIWGQNSLAIRSGVDIPYLAYCDAFGIETRKCVCGGNKSIKWINFSADFLACFGTSGYLNRGELTFKQWIESFKGKKAFAFFSVDDIDPFIIMFWTFLSSLYKGVLNRAKKNLNAL